MMCLCWFVDCLAWCLFGFGRGVWFAVFCWWFCFVVFVCLFVVWLVGLFFTSMMKN